MGDYWDSFDCEIQCEEYNLDWFGIPEEEYEEIYGYDD